jgi:tetratricopeptide (TPR) repeat protein
MLVSPAPDTFCFYLGSDATCFWSAGGAESSKPPAQEGVYGDNTLHPAPVPVAGNAELETSGAPCVVVDKGDASRATGENKMCSIQPFPGMANSVSVTSLQIPRKAQKEYERACADLKNTKLPEAEQHLHKATEIYPNYVAGWVMLGQILETRQQTAGARDACSRASGADPSYLPAYLCLAEIAGRGQEWHEVLNLTSRALELDPVHDA